MAHAAVTLGQATCQICHRQLRTLTLIKLARVEVDTRRNAYNLGNQEVSQYTLVCVCQLLPSYPPQAPHQGSYRTSHSDNSLNFPPLFDQEGWRPRSPSPIRNRIPVNRNNRQRVHRRSQSNPRERPLTPPPPYQNIQQNQ